MVPDEVPKDASMHVAQLNPSPLALRLGRPDTKDLGKQLRLAGVTSYSMGYLVRCQCPGKPRGNAHAWQQKVLKAAAHCHKAHATFSSDLPIAAVGKEVFSFYSGGEDLYMWRGFRYETKED